MLHRDEAQGRVAQIRAFHAELDALRAAQVLALSDEQLAAIRAAHDQLLTKLAAEYDIDRTDEASRLSRGMQLASFFAAVTLTAAVYSLVSRFWRRMDLPLQATLLSAFPLIALVGVELAARRERTLYVASLFAVVSYGTFWLAIGVLSETLNVPVVPPWIWAGALFGVALALPYRFRLILGVALVSLIVAIAGSIFQAAGYPWDDIVRYLDVLTVTAFATLVLAPRLAELDRSFGPVTRLVGCGIGLFGLLAMSTAGEMSLLPAGNETTELIYQAVMLVVCITLLVIGVRRAWHELVHLTAVVFTLFLLVRFVDWFWDTLPGYVFFSILAAIAFAWLVVLRRVRGRLIRARAGR